MAYNQYFGLSENFATLLLDLLSWKKSTARVKSNPNFLRPHWFTIPMVDRNWHKFLDTPPVEWRGLCLLLLTLGGLYECSDQENAAEVRQCQFQDPGLKDIDSFLFQSSRMTSWTTRSPTILTTRKSPCLERSCKRLLQEVWDQGSREMLDQLQLLPVPGSVWNKHCGAEASLFDHCPWPWW